MASISLGSGASSAATLTPSQFHGGYAAPNWPSIGPGDPAAAGARRRRCDPTVTCPERGLGRARGGFSAIEIHSHTTGAIGQAQDGRLAMTPVVDRLWRVKHPQKDTSQIDWGSILLAHGHPGFIQGQLRRASKASKAASF
ncbi:hypothetical protein CROQUDRAFT_99170 [Cronartium quercuum f. sp. fusiforme G11]|uniref:Uncharacterized protein n=1 Tax=Cronartium quercuum f. sp. fusiforme G11 TaxID=708437 RepID=A0A9P6NC72_9BASI|nr:hypothetical protein CROQUDRAFT_99170 [Cronartium quercuum f. sp. fusiforme G11]